MTQTAKIDEVLSETKGFKLKCEAEFSRFSDVVSFNWIYNGTFIHPSLNPGLSVLTNGDLNFDKIYPIHAGDFKKIFSLKMYPSNRWLYLPCSVEI